MNSYLIDGPMPAIDWKISGDTATFGGLHCQKATCHFKGRDYIGMVLPRPAGAYRSMEIKRVARRDRRRPRCKKRSGI